jgi:hypothetical protein
MTANGVLGSEGEHMPKQIDEQRFQMAVMCLALGRAKSAVKAQILADGLKLSAFTCVELNKKREAYFACHMEELIAAALVDVWRLPLFARYRPQTQSQSQP